MKSKILLLVVLVVLITGCTNINNESYKSLVNKTIKQKSTSNLASNGYNLFVPNGMTIISDKDNNLIFYSNGKRYYMYVDLVSYFNKSENNYTKLEGAFYSKTFDVDDKKLYVTIKKIENENHLIVQYNYAKIEVVTDNIKEDLVRCILILNNVKYNDVVIKSLIGSSSFDYNEEQYNLKSPKEKKADNSQFLQYKEDYGNYEDPKDEDIVEVKD